LHDYFSCQNNNFADWREWPVEYHNPYSEAVCNFEKNNIEKIEFYEFLQWQAHLQLGELGGLSFYNKLGIGLISEIPFYLNTKGAASWAEQDVLTIKGVKASQDHNHSNLLTFLPQMLEKSAYDYFRSLIQNNMVHTGAVKFNDIRALSASVFSCDENKNFNIAVKQHIDELLGIISLESQRNKCAVIYDDKKSISEKLRKKLDAHNFIKESDLICEKI